MFSLFQSSQIKVQRLFDYAGHDPFFERVSHDLIDFGHDIRFSLFGGSGAYRPYGLCTDVLDSPEKYEKFHIGFSRAHERGEMNARIVLPALGGQGRAAHLFLHEMMHFYQDMCGLYLVPLQERGVFPFALDAYSEIVAILFSEAWAQTEAIRASWAIREKGDDLGWRGAVSSPDWGDLARRYDDDLSAGADEAKAAANVFEGWYAKPQRGVYERHALGIYQQNLKRYHENAPGVLGIDPYLRRLELLMLLARLPQGAVPRFFAHLDWSKPAFCVPLIDLGGYGEAENPNIQEIRCGSPPYLWARLREEEIKRSEIMF